MLSSLKRSPTRRCSVSKELRSPTRSFGKSKLLKSPGDNTFIRIEEVDPTDVTVKIEEAPLTIPKFNHASKGKLPKINLKGIIGPNKGKTSSEKSPTTSKVPQKKQPNNKGRTLLLSLQKRMCFPREGGYFHYSVYFSCRQNG